MSNNDKMAQVYENMTKKSIASSGLYDPKEVQPPRYLVGHPSGNQRPSDKPNKSTTKESTKGQAY